MRGKASFCVPLKQRWHQVHSLGRWKSRTLSQTDWVHQTPGKLCHFPELATWVIWERESHHHGARRLLCLSGQTTCAKPWLPSAPVTSRCVSLTSTLVSVFDTHVLWWSRIGAASVCLTNGRTALHSESNCRLIHSFIHSGNTH